jgi:hypothetical protein
MVVPREVRVVVPRKTRRLTIHARRNKKAGGQKRSEECPRYLTHIRSFREEPEIRLPDVPRAREILNSKHLPRTIVSDAGSRSIARAQ